MRRRWVDGRGQWHVVIRGRGPSDWELGVGVERRLGQLFTRSRTRLVACVVLRSKAVAAVLRLYMRWSNDEQAKEWALHLGLVHIRAGNRQFGSTQPVVWAMM